VIHPDLPAFLSYLDSLEGTPLPKHATTDETLPLLTTEVGRALDGLAARVFDGHLVIDFANPANGKIGGRILHAHDQSEIGTFGIQLTTS
jgi:hypothetical protein